MGAFDSSREPKSDIAFMDMKFFYASVDYVERELRRNSLLSLMVLNE